MSKEPKEIISFRVSPKLKIKLQEASERNGFDNLSLYLEQLSFNTLDNTGVNTLNHKDLQLIRRAMQIEFDKERTELKDFIREEFKRLRIRK